MKLQNISYNKILMLALMCISSLLLSCSKLVEVDAPVTGTSGDVVYTKDQTAISVLTGLYTKLSGAGFPSDNVASMSFWGGVSSDELTLFSGVSDQAITEYYTNAVTDKTTVSFWQTLYPTIYIANSAIEEIEKATTLTPVVKNQLLGEAKFMRAFYYFYLINIYGDVPLVLTSDYSKSAFLARTPQASVYAQIITDLSEAQILLSPTYLDGTLLKTTADRVRPTKWAAMALLSRAYLYSGQYSKAKETATNIISQSSMFSLDLSTTAFLKNSPEAIWQLQSIKTGQNTSVAWLFKLPSTGPNISNPVYLSDSLYNAFESGDKRKTDWVGSVTVGSITYRYANKYKSATLNASVTENESVFRTAEQYLIRAEANLKLSDTAAAKTDINAVRARAGLGAITTNDTALLAKLLQKERRIELFTEWGHRWIDLKRTGTVDNVMSKITPLKGGTWKTTSQLYPIPLTELQSNPNLKQNNGY